MLINTRIITLFWHGQTHQLYLLGYVSDCTRFFHMANKDNKLKSTRNARIISQALDYLDYLDHLDYLDYLEYLDYLDYLKAAMEAITGVNSLVQWCITSRQTWNLYGTKRGVSRHWLSSRNGLGSRMSIQQMYVFVIMYVLFE